MPLHLVFFFVNNAATTATYTLSLHDALPICNFPGRTGHNPRVLGAASVVLAATAMLAVHHSAGGQSWYSGVGSGYLFRSEEHTSELQSHVNLVCRLLLEKKKQTLSSIASSRV